MSERRGWPARVMPERKVSGPYVAPLRTGIVWVRIDLGAGPEWIAVARVAS